MTRYLSEETCIELVDTAVKLDILKVDIRDALLTDIEKGYVDSLPLHNNPLDQFRSDLNQLNGVDFLLDTMGKPSVPLRIWLYTIVNRPVFKTRREIASFQKALDEVVAESERRIKQAASDGPIKPPGSTGITSGISRLLIGIIFFIIVLFLVYFFTLSGLIPQIDPIIELLVQSPAWQLALWSFSTALSSGLWLISYGLIFILRINLQIKTGRIEAEIPVGTPANTAVLSALFGIPAWFMVLIFLASLSGLYLSYPHCQAPVIAFEIQGQKEIAAPDQTIFANPDSSMIITAISVDDKDAAIRCRWTFGGKIIQNLGQPYSCTTSIKLSKVLGTGITTVTASKEFCNLASSSSLRITTQRP